MLQQQSSVPAPVFGLSWDLLGRRELNRSRGAEELGGTPASPWPWVWWLWICSAWCNPKLSQPPPLRLTAIPDHPLWAPALLHDGSHPPRPSLPSSPVQYQGPFQPRSKNNHGAAEVWGGRGNGSIPILVSTSRRRCPGKPATCAKDDLASNEAVCSLGHRPSISPTSRVRPCSIAL